MDMMQAIETRISCRAFDDERVIETEKLDELRSMCDLINAETGLSFALVNAPLPLMAKMFVGEVDWYLALVGPHDNIGGEKVGYYGEKLVLRATQLGLGTCWVAGTFDRNRTKFEAAEGEYLWDVIPLGYAPEKFPLKTRTIRAAIRKSTKKPQKLVSSRTAFAELPDWYRAAIDAVIAGPSAVNGEPVVFTWDNGAITAGLPNFKREMEYNDLGIAKLHFELAAEAYGIKGTWEWGVKGAFTWE